MRTVQQGPTAELRGLRRVTSPPLLSHPIATEMHKAPAGRLRGPWCGLLPRPALEGGAGSEPAGVPVSRCLGSTTAAVWGWRARERHPRGGHCVSRGGTGRAPGGLSLPEPPESAIGVSLAKGVVGKEGGVQGQKIRENIRGDRSWVFFLPPLTPGGRSLRASLPPQAGAGQ